MSTFIVTDITIFCQNTQLTFCNLMRYHAPHLCALKEVTLFIGCTGQPLLAPAGKSKQSQMVSYSTVFLIYLPHMNQLNEPVQNVCRLQAFCAAVVTLYTSDWICRSSPPLIPKGRPLYSLLKKSLYLYKYIMYICINTCLLSQRSLTQNSREGYWTIHVKNECISYSNFIYLNSSLKYITCVFYIVVFGISLIWGISTNAPNREWPKALHNTEIPFSWLTGSLLSCMPANIVL